MVVNNTNISRYLSFRRCPKNSEILYRVSLCRDEIHAEIRQKSTNRIFFCHGSSGLQQNWLNISTGTKFPPVDQKSQRFVRRITLGTSGLASWLLKGAVYLPSLKRISRSHWKFAGPEKEQKKYSNVSCYVSFREFIFLDGFALIGVGISLPKMPGTFIQNSWNSRTEANTFSPPAAKCPLMTQMYRPSSHGISHFLLGTINHHTTAHRVWEIPFVGRPPSNNVSYIRMKYKPQPIQGWMLSPPNKKSWLLRVIIWCPRIFWCLLATSSETHSLCCGISNMLIGNTSSRYEVWWLYLQMETFHLSLL